MSALPLPTVLRPLAYGTFASALGNGAWYASWALFLTRAVELTVAEAGIALTIAGVAGIAGATPIGKAADRLGPREVLVALSTIRGSVMAGFLLADGVVGVTLAASVMAAAQQGQVAAKTALIAGLTAPDERLESLASLRVIGHAGDALGAAAGALVIQLDSDAAYTALICANALTYGVYALAAARLPGVAPRPREHHRPALHDTNYVALAAICGVLTLSWAVMSTALPLWVAGHTEAPRATSGVLVVISSVAIALLQVRATRAAKTPAAAARAAIVSGCALALSCLLFALAGGPVAEVAAILLLAGGIAHVAGELLFVAASWGLSVPLMPEGRAGEYQGVFATGEAVALAAAPLAMTTVVAAGQPGWLALAALFAAATLPAPAITRRAAPARA